MQRYNPTSSQSMRASQAWMILIGMAKNRQTVTYSGLAELMYHRKAAGVLAQILGRIAFYCEVNDLPQLNAIVVGKKRGSPGHDIPLDPGEVDATRERVFACDWYDICPPTEHEFDESLCAGSNP